MNLYDGYFQFKIQTGFLLNLTSTYPLFYAENLIFSTNKIIHVLYPTVNTTAAE